MSEDNTKSLRKQIRNVLQEVGREEFVKETKEDIYKKTLELMNTRLDSIDKYCREELQRQDKRAKAIQTFIVQEVVNRVQSDLFDVSVSTEALISALEEYEPKLLGLNKKIEDKKIEISERRKRESDEAMKAEMERRAKEEAEKKAAELQPPQESAPKAE